MLGCLSYVTLIFHSKFPIKWRFRIWCISKNDLSTSLFFKQVFWRDAINQDKLAYFYQVGNPQWFWKNTKSDFVFGIFYIIFGNYMQNVTLMPSGNYYLPKNAYFFALKMPIFDGSSLIFSPENGFHVMRQKK